MTGLGHYVAAALTGVFLLAAAFGVGAVLVEGVYRFQAALRKETPGE